MKTPNTKPSPTQPTAGAMRAVKLTREVLEACMSSIGGYGVEPPPDAELAQIIDRETDVAELVAALEYAEIVMANLRGDLLAGREINRKECAANLLINAEKIRAVLARHAGAGEALP